MIYLCCDTNIWINISNGLEPPRLLNRLYEEVQNRNITLLLPEIILKEWDRNKKKNIIEKTQKSTKEQIDSLVKLKEFLERDELDLPFLWGDLEEQEYEKVAGLREKIDGLIIDLKAHKTAIINKANDNLNRVEDIFKNPNTVVLPADNNSSLCVVNLAIDKSFPFENNKNNFADCLIFYQFANYLKDNKLESGHFVTSNKSEFFPKGNLHELFQNEINKTNSFFYRSLSEALNKSLKEQLVNLKELKRVEELASIENYFDSEYCVVCSGTDHVEPILEFSFTIPIVDSRLKNDPGQLYLFEGEYLPRSVEESDINEAEGAVCISCGTEHIICPGCRDIWDFETYEINKIQYCDGCNLRFIYDKEQGRKGEWNRIHLELLDDLDRCSKCGNEFDSSESGIDICEVCNDEYINK